MERRTAVQKLIKRLGGQEALATAAGVSQQAVSYWAKNLPLVPIERVPRISEATGIPQHELRPDFFPAPTGKSKAGSDIETPS